MKYILVVFLISFCSLGILNTPVFSEDSTNYPDSLIENNPNIYLDCQECDFDYLRRELTFVNFVRDRKQASVHILVSEQRTGSGGREFTVEFIGKNEFSTMTDTLKLITIESDTDDKIRTELNRIFKLGLIRYVARTPLSKDISIGYSKPSQSVEVKDKWNYWVFQVEGNFWLNGQKSYRSFNFWGNLSARRVTEKMKLYFEIWGNYNEDRFDYDDYEALSISRSKGTSGSIIKSIHNHWSIGYFYNVYSSSYSNTKNSIWSSPGIEYNLFPYDQSSRRQLRFIYKLSANYVKYDEETIFNKFEEWLTEQSLRVSLELIQPWGSISTTLSGSHYFHDFSKNRVRLYGRFSFRVFEGFSFNMDGQVSRIRDQLSLRKGSADEEEVLLRRTELATSYSYRASVGISYSFGSIYNNIVNPRFGN
ncbi:MAG: hypothetical protein ACE5D6_00965 [Candidatus Zixiibacteriota bacterium]